MTGRHNQAKTPAFCRAQRDAATEDFQCFIVKYQGSEGKKFAIVHYLAIMDFTKNDLVG